MNIYFVYIHIRLDINEPFYVGMGKKNRHINFNRRNKYWKNIYNKCNKNIKVEVLFNSLTEEEALLKETEVELNLKNKGYKLTNIAKTGTKGSTGHKKSKEWKESYSRLMKLTNSGRKLSKEHKINLSKALKGRKGTRNRILNQYDLNNNLIKEWNSAKEAELFYKTYSNGKCGNGINNCCRGIQKTAHNFKWKYK